MTRSWSRTVSPISAAVSASVLLAVLVSSASAAEPKLFSRSGDGQSFDAYLVSSEAAGLEQNQIANVRFVASGRKPSTAEWIVNCNENFPQVVSPSGTNSDVDIAHPPSVKNRFKYELWFAACRNQFAKAAATAGASLVSTNDLAEPAAPPLEQTKGIASLTKDLLLGHASPEAVGQSFDGRAMSQVAFLQRLSNLTFSEVVAGEQADGAASWVAVAGDDSSALCALAGERVSTCVFFDLVRQPAACSRVDSVFSVTLVRCGITRGYGTGFFSGGEAIFALTPNEIRLAGYFPTLDYSGLSNDPQAIVAVAAENKFDEPMATKHEISVRRCPVVTFEAKSKKAPCERYIFEAKSMTFRSESGANIVDQSMLEAYAKLARALTRSR